MKTILRKNPSNLESGATMGNIELIEGAKPKDTAENLLAEIQDLKEANEKLRERLENLFKENQAEF
jgi:ubiquinone biosynthesis protein UbiJ